MAATITPPSVAGRLDAIIKSVDMMRPLPTIVHRVLQTLDSEKASAGYIAELLGLDQALAANVLQAANSAFLGYGPSCSNLADAVMRLGFKRIRILVLAVAAAGPMKKDLNGYRLGTGELWNHAVATGVAAQWFARELKYPEPEDAYVAGLLHDIGKLILDQYALADYQTIFQFVQARDLAMWEVEQEVFGVTHAVVGGLIARKWSFPTELVDAINHHHNPIESTRHRELASLVNIANALTPVDSATLAKLGKRMVAMEAFNVLGLTQPRLDNMNERMTIYYKNNFGNLLR